MCGPPDPEMRRAALAGSPQSQMDNSNEESSLSAPDFQAHRLRRLFSFCQATACTIASLARGVAR
jgi:hypothetical protein